MFHSNSDSTSKKAYNQGRQAGIDAVIERLLEISTGEAWSEDEKFVISTIARSLCDEFPAESSENESEY